MPELGKIETEKVYLPSTEGVTTEDEKAWVMLKKNLLLGDKADIEAIEDPTDAAITSLVRLIQDWNFTKDGVKYEINAETVRLLDIHDFNHIAAVLKGRKQKAEEGLDTDEKKDSTVSSTEEAGPTPTLQPTTSNTVEQ